MGGSDHFEIKSRLSGVFYRTPEPDAPPFVEVGTEVEQGQTVALVESMKLFTKIKSPVAGTVVEILVDNEDPIATDQVLMRLERGEA